MRALLRIVGSLLVLGSLAGLALLAAGPGAGEVAERPLDGQGTSAVAAQAGPASQTTEAVQTGQAAQPGQPAEVGQAAQPGQAGQAAQAGADPTGSSDSSGPSQTADQATNGASDSQQAAASGTATAEQGAAAFPGETPSGPGPEPPPLVASVATRSILEETFADNRMLWPDEPRSTAWLAWPGYRLAPREPGKFVAVAAPVPAPLVDVLVTATFRKLGGPSGGGYGLILRDQHVSAGDGVSQQGRFYVLEVGDRGEVGIWRRDEDRFVDLVPWTASEAVRPGTEINVLEAWATGDRLTLMVNGVQVASTVDATFANGGVGLFAGGDGNSVQVEHFSVRVPADPRQADAQPTPEAQTAAAAPAQATATAQPAFRPITRVAIRSIGLDAPSVPAGLVERDGAVTWSVPPMKVGHAEDTAGAGSPGNAVLVGHVTSRNLGNVFERLHQVGPGETVEVFSGDQQFVYRVVSVKTVSRNDVSVVKATPTPSLTMITCTGTWLPLVNDFSQRVVVRAELVP